MSMAAGDLSLKAQEAKSKLDAHVREIVEWHFNPETGCPFWLDFAAKLGWDPRREIRSFQDLKRFPPFQDDWLRGGPLQRWMPKGLAGMPLYVFETGGTTGIPKSRLAIEDFRIDYEMFSETLPDEYFPKGANWLMLGPSGPRRLRLAVEHLCQHRGGICFCVDLDPRWVIKLIKQGNMDGLEKYKAHVIEQAITHSRRRARHPLHVHDAEAARGTGRGTREARHQRQGNGHHRHFRRRHRVHAAVHPIRDGGIAGRGSVSDADLRQYAHGAGVLEACYTRRRLQDQLLCAAAPGRHRSGLVRRCRQDCRTTAKPGACG